MILTHLTQRLRAKPVRWIGLARQAELARPSPIAARRLRTMRCFFYAAYAPADADKIEPLLEAAHAEGHLIWRDRIDADRAPMDLGAALRRACAVIIFCSAEAYQSRAIYKELVLAARSGKAILPVYLDDQLPPDQYLFYLSRHRGLRADKPGARERFRLALEAFERGRRSWREPEKALEPPPPTPQTVAAREPAIA